MAEYWKSTPKYWCKHCSCYVRDTKLERQNHEATGKHQGALKRFLRDLHRGHERQERDKERAQQEITRLNGIVESGGSQSAKPYSRGVSLSSGARQGAPSTSESQLQKQRDQLADLGVSIPSDFRPEMAMPGEWTVTSTRVIEKDELLGIKKVEAQASGVRKREETEEQREEDEAIRGLFKRPRRWGKDSKVMPQEEDLELDALLEASLQPAPGPIIKDEEGENEDGTVEVEEEVDVKPAEPSVKTEPDEDGETSPLQDIKSGDTVSDMAVKSEPNSVDRSVGAVVFKKRKPKGLRNK